MLHTFGVQVLIIPTLGLRELCLISPQYRILRTSGTPCKVQRLRVQGSGLRVQCSGFRVQGLGFQGIIST